MLPTSPVRQFLLPFSPPALSVGVVVARLLVHAGRVRAPSLLRWSEHTGSCSGARTLHSGSTVARDAKPADGSRSLSGVLEAAPVRVRFAPSPTGSVHLGGLRTALYNYVFAKQHGGQFILRIEDTDRTRLVPGAEEALCRTLDWAGLTPDEGPFRGGPYGPYRQSERVELYQRHAKDLLARGAAYRCFCSTERLDRLRSRKGPSQYDRKCRHFDPEESEFKAAKGEPFVIRFKAPAEGASSFVDIVRGTITQPNSAIDDGVILKSDGYPTYHLANVVDDHLMRITHVLRGAEWICSTPKHIMIYAAFGWSPPKFAHLPLLVNPDGTKLSKRAGDVHVKAYEERGYLPSALINYVSLLGWHPGKVDDIMTISDIMSMFSLEKVNRDSAVGHFSELDRLNKIHMQRVWQTPKGREHLLVEVRRRLQCQYADRIPEERYTDAYIVRVLNLLVKERITTLQDFVDLHPQFFLDVDLSAPEALKIYQNVGSETIELVLREAIGVLTMLAAKEGANIEDVNGAREVIAMLRNREQLAPLKTQIVMVALRWALMGLKEGPSIAECLHVLGIQRSLRRLENGRQFLHALEEPSRTAVEG